MKNNCKIITNDFHEAVLSGDYKVSEEMYNDIKDLIEIGDKYSSCEIPLTLSDDEIDEVSCTEDINLNILDVVTLGHIINQSEYELEEIQVNLNNLLGRKKYLTELIQSSQLKIQNKLHGKI